MAEQIPLKVIRAGVNTVKLGEFDPTDTIPIAHVPDIIALDGTPLTDFNNHLAATNPHSITPAIIGAPTTSDFTIHTASINPHGVTVANIGAAAQAAFAAHEADNDAHGGHRKFTVVADEAARLALVANEGDEAKQLDTGIIWTYDGTIWHEDPFPTSIFGAEFQKAESLGVSTTTSSGAGFQEKINFVTTNLPAGDYRVGVSYGWNHDATGNDFEARLELNSAVVGEIHKQEPQDSGGTFSTTASSQRYYVSRVHYLTLTGINTFSLRYRTDTPGAESSMWDAVIELWRVA